MQSIRDYGGLSPKENIPVKCIPSGFKKLSKEEAEDGNSNSQSGWKTQENNSVQTQQN